MKDSYDTICRGDHPLCAKGLPCPPICKAGSGRHFATGLCDFVQSHPCQCQMETFSYFKEQDVAIRVISGDNPQTVSEVARRAGIEGAENYVDASTLDSKAKIRDAVERYTVFGRVNAKAEAVDRQSLAGGRTYRCHDRRWCQRHLGNERCRLQCGNGIRQRGMRAGGTGRPFGFGFCQNAGGRI